ncbi:MAG: hypothetical protein K9G46_02870 [Flavobacteriales bacterium]|jgi:hypothetical protein|nr:hypothetical protein [Flavobacteriales bacterium]
MRPLTNTLSFIVLLCLSIGSIHAQDVTTVEATSTDISDNLDLKAVASLFGVCEDLQDFERKLNDPESKLSNLDLNGDNQVDYLRVVEVSKDGTYVITIQAVIGPDQFQDVATIDVEKDKSGETRVQVVGDVYMYGSNYIIEPYYQQPPVVYVYLWGPRYNPWYSPYYWGYYPTYYNPWNPYPTYYYMNHVHVHHHSTVTYTYVTHRHSSRAVVLQQSQHRGDYQAKKPEQTFETRNQGMVNKQDLIVQREKSSPVKPATTEKQTETKTNARPVQSDWKPASGETQGTKVSVPTTTKQATDATGKPKIDLSKDPVPSKVGDVQTKPTTPAADPYGRQPASTPTSVKQDQYTRPTDTRVTQPQNQNAKPAAEPSRVPSTQPATQPRTSPAQTAPAKPSGAKDEAPTRQAPSAAPATKSTPNAVAPAKPVTRPTTKPTGKPATKPSENRSTRP